MVSPNTKFELDVSDIELIEEALGLLQHHRAGTVGFQVQSIEDLRAKIWHQKRWYRPKGVYISG